MEPKHKNHTYSKKAPTASKSGVQKRVTLPQTGRTPSAHSTSAYGNASRAAHGVGGGVKSAAVVIRPWQIILSVLVVLTLVVGGVAVGVMLGRGDSDVDRFAEDFDWIPPSGSNTNPDGITLPGYSSVVLPAGEKNIQMVLPNPSTNPCYFRFTLVLKDTGEVLYTSGLIPPGMAVKQVKLS
ncbi:MAG: hypothetical protein IJW50_00005, partial [Clostridia bacterium]|nr:hypothetical protein [Clostridia bacterium]